jgi:DNA-binding NtrC family response regulator
MSTASQPEMLITGGDDCSRRAIAALLQRQGYAVEQADSTQRALRRLQEQTIPLALVDAGTGADCAEVIRRIRRRSPHTQTIVLAEQGSAGVAEQSLSAGAQGYFARPIRDWKRFHAAIDRCITQRADVVPLPVAQHHGALARIKGNAPSTQRLICRLQRLAKLPDPLLIRGESGVGKELVARAVHDESPWSTGPFIAVNCAAIKPELFESALFGHRAGSFTGAVREHSGLIEAASGGTLFLDEIGELPAELQAKLLRLLEQREYRRVGEEATRTLSARVVAATHVDLEDAIVSGAFRKDLYFRLSAFELHVPPLRKRRADIQLLAYHFLHLYNQRYDRQIDRIEPGVMRRLEASSWRRNNIRELEWCIRQAVALSDNPDELTLDAFGNRLSEVEPQDADEEGAAEAGTITDNISVDGLYELSYSVARTEARRRFARWYVLRCLEEADYNQAYAAELAGMKRPNFIRLMRDLEISGHREQKIVVNAS